MENPRLELQFSEWLKSTSVKPTDGGHSEAAPVDVHDPVMAMKEQALARLRSLFLTEQTGWTRVRTSRSWCRLFAGFRLRSFLILWRSTPGD